MGWLGVLQGAGGAAQRVTPGTGRREEALIHFWKTEPNRRIKSASRLRVVGLCGPQRSLSFGTIREPGLAWGRLRGPRPQARESSTRGQTLNTKKMSSGSSLVLFVPFVRFGNSFPGRGLNVTESPGPVDRRLRIFSLSLLSHIITSPSHRISSCLLLLLLGCGRPAEVSGFPLVPCQYTVCVPGSGLLR